MFGSWVIWMWELCKEESFQKQWQTASIEEAIEFNYVGELREIVNAGIFYATAPLQEVGGVGGTPVEITLDDQRRAFFRFVAQTMIHKNVEGEPDAYVERWLGRRYSVEGEREEQRAFVAHWFGQRHITHEDAVKEQAALAAVWKRELADKARQAKA